MDWKTYKEDFLPREVINLFREASASPSKLLRVVRFIDTPAHYNTFNKRKEDEDSAPTSPNINCLQRDYDWRHHQFYAERVYAAVVLDSLWIGQ